MAEMLGNSGVVGRKDQTEVASFDKVVLWPVDAIQLVQTWRNQHKIQAVPPHEIERVRDGGKIFERLAFVDQHAHAVPPAVESPRCPVEPLPNHQAAERQEPGLLVVCYCQVERNG